MAVVGEPVITNPSLVAVKPEQINGYSLRYNHSTPWFYGHSLEVLLRYFQGCLRVPVHPWLRNKPDPKCGLFTQGQSRANPCGRAGLKKVP